MKRKAMGAAFRDTIPVMTGYLFLGFGFGILLQQAGYGAPWAVAMSLFVFAGSMQFVAVSLLSSGAGLLTVALTTLLVNARHLFYGISTIDRYKGAGKKKPYLIFGLTDETFSLVSSDRAPEGVSRHSYYFWVTLLDHCYWVAGTLLGSLTGALLPLDLKGIEFVLTALFVTIFVEQWLSSKDHLPAVIGLTAAGFCLALFGKNLFLVPAMALITGILVGLPKARKGERM